MNEMTIEELENSFWPDSGSFETKMVEKIVALRRKPISSLSPDDMRLLISQGIGTEILMPRIIRILERDVLFECVYYPGDLLNAVLSLDSYWNTHKPEAISFRQLLMGKIDTLQLSDEITTEIKDELLIKIDKLVHSSQDLT